MIKLPNDFDSARAYDGQGGPVLPIGGHICRITGARIEKASQSGADMLVVAFDIAEEGQYYGFYAAKYDRARSYSDSAKWPGIFRTGIINREGKTNAYFKGLITAVEESNPGYLFKATGGDEGTLKGKIVGFNFGEREFIKRDNTIGVIVEPFYAISAAKVREGVIAPARKVLNDAPRATGQPDAQGFTPVEDDELPF